MGKARLNLGPGAVTAALALLVGFSASFLFRVRPELPRAFWSLVEGVFSSSRHGECNHAISLKTISSAQADFRANDRDRDGVNQFWRGDIAGLYALLPRDADVRLPDWRDSQAIKLVELSVAAADDRPVVDITRFGKRGPKNGYRLRAIRHADEDPEALDPNRFAACAFPDDPKTDRYMFVIDENNTIFRAAAKGRGVDVFPTDEELQKSWSKLD